MGAMRGGCIRRLIRKPLILFMAHETPLIYRQSPEIHIKMPSNLEIVFHGLLVVFHGVVVLGLL